MRIILSAALALTLLPILAAAQDMLPSSSLQMGLPSASLDRRPVDGSLPRDLYRATPTTFAPGFEEPPRVDPRFFPCCAAYPGPIFMPPVTWGTPAPQVVYVPILIEREVPRAAPAPPPAAAPPPPPPPPPAPGVPKTFYVIPGCYAGDKPPDRDALPRGCDIRRLRTIPPR